MIQNRDEELWTTKLRRGKEHPLWGKGPISPGQVTIKGIDYPMRSQWEGDFALLLESLKEEYEYEPKVFELSDGSSYTPDFLLKKYDVWAEIKGLSGPGGRGKKKLEQFIKDYPDEKIIVLSGHEIAEFELKNIDAARWDCPRLPKNFNFDSIINISEVGLEDTYDIAMQSPYNNYIANGILVHNSSGMQGALREVGADRFEDLVAIVSLYRPGPMAYIPVYAQNKKNPGQIKYLDPRLKEILSDTYGIAVYQEDLMRMSRAVAGFTPGEADGLRKVVGKKLIQKLPDLKKKFIKGCLENNTSKDVADQLWKLVEAAGSYSFNKSHAACYAYISYMTAWLKANYPTQYMAALLTSVMNTKDKVPFYLYEARRMGLRVLPPDVNQSYDGFTVTGEGEMRFGLEAIKNVGGKVIENIVGARKEDGNFKSIWDFARRVPSANKRTMEFLVKAGAFDSLQGSRRAMLDVLPEVVEVSKKQRAQGEVTNVGTLFESVEEEMAASLGFEDSELPVEEGPYQERLGMEFEALGVYASGHPVDENYDAWEQTATATLGKITEALEGEQVTVVGVVLEKKVIYTRRGGNKMCFLRLNDPTGTQEIVFFSSVLEVPGMEDVLQEGALVGVTARVAEDTRGGREKTHENDDTGVARPMKLLAQRAFAFDPQRIPKRETYWIDVDETRFSKRLVGLLRGVLREHVGDTPVKLRLKGSDGTQKTYKLGDEYRVRINHELEEKIRTVLSQ